jgi:diacylglycerol kinase family enzyme
VKKTSVKIMFNAVLFCPFIYIFASNNKSMEKSAIKREWFAIVNPNAGNGKGKMDWSRIADLLKKNGIPFDMMLTKSKGHAIELTRELIEGGYKKFISVGGDGTLNEVVNGVFAQEFCLPGEITLSMIPVGTGNDWGRMFGIPLVYEGAVQIIKA